MIYKLLYIRHTCFVCGKTDDTENATAVLVRLHEGWTEEFEGLRVDGLSPVTIRARCSDCSKK